MVRRPQGIVLPTFRSPALSDAVLDRVSFTVQAKAVGGAILGTGPDIPTDQRWFIEHATSFCDSTTATTLRLYAGTVAQPYLLDGSGSGNADFGDWNPGLLVTSRLLALWSGASAGATGTLNVQVTIMTRGGS